MKFDFHKAKKFVAGRIKRREWFDCSTLPTKGGCSRANQLQEARDVSWLGAFVTQYITTIFFHLFCPKELSNIQCEAINHYFQTDPGGDYSAQSSQNRSKSEEAATPFDQRVW